MKTGSMLIAAALAVAAPVIAVQGQVAAPVVAVTTLAVGKEATPMLHQGTEVRFETVQALSSADSKEGDRFELKSIEDLRVGQMLVIPAGSRAVGEVTRVVKKGAFGKSGKLDARILYVIVGDTHISMTGKANDSGTAGTGGVVVAAVLFWPVMPFITGTSANLPSGTRFSGFVENDIALLASSAPTAAPLVVPIAAPLVVHEAPPPVVLSAPAVRVPATGVVKVSAAVPAASPHLIPAAAHDGGPSANSVDPAATGQLPQ